ncbi:YjbQ family protein [Pseudokineococcus marinus]|uniref:YjbQ family protein n=1 Tax=Pseudokineococcus marinus TaxID=351215 RepID=A0A849BQM4_9ACTN|nr:YjbQ family protein [Pseudokineococcus marinus]NNH23673.1 YjbQ family protein [Pseudokineococcus marinus]
METTTLAVRTGGDERVVDLTARVEEALDDWGAAEGLLSVFVPHATAGVAVLETGAGSDEDLLRALRDVLPAAGPQGEGWRHAHGSPGHGRDHVLPALVSPSLVLPVLDGRPALGTWQSVCLVDTNRDNADRTVRLSFVRG